MSRSEDLFVDFGREAEAAASAQERVADPYSRPTMRPCRAVDAEGAPVSLPRRFRALGEDLPLAGAGAMRPTLSGGVDLCDRLRLTLPWLEPAIGAMERQLKVRAWAGAAWLGWRPLCLAGPPGGGKSSLAHEVGRLSGAGCATLDVGGMHDAAALVAVSVGWNNAKPCWPAEMIASLRCANPVLTLDELEKAGGSRANGDPLKAVLAMLEPATAVRYFDTCLMTEVDLSAVCWICTVNDASLLPRPLASRLDIVEVPPPGPEHFDLVLTEALRRLAERLGLPATDIPPIGTTAETVLRQAFARHRCLRSLARHVERVVAASVPARRMGVH